jgi:hypothetical protein
MTTTLEAVLLLARQLSPLDKVRLVEQISSQLQYDLTTAQAAPRKSLRGLWQGLEITEVDIAEMRQEVGQNFPCEDI